MSLQDYTFNPGNLTVNKSGQILYPGQTGTYAANGFQYATFANVADGLTALTDYASRHVATGWNTAQKFAFGYLGTSTANAANPYPQSYAATLAKFFNPADPSAIAKGIATAEGNGKMIAGVTGTSNPAPAAGSSWLGWASGQLGNTAIGAGRFWEGVTGTAKDPAAGMNALTEEVGKTFNIFGGTAQRVALIVLGVILVGGALMLLAMGSKSVQTAVKVAAVA